MIASFSPLLLRMGPDRRADAEALGWLVTAYEVFDIFHYNRVVVSEKKESK